MVCVNRVVKNCRRGMAWERMLMFRARLEQGEKSDGGGADLG